MSNIAIRLIQDNIEKKQRGEDASFFYLGRCGISEIPQEISKLVWIDRLILEGNISLTDINLLTGLSKLRILDCSSTSIENLSPLSALINLRQINCSNTKVNSLKPLSNLSNLRIIDCSNTKVEDLSALAGLLNLQQINCSKTKIHDLTPIANLCDLTHLNCSKTKIVDLTPIINLCDLTHLNCSNTGVSDLAPLLHLKSLRVADCSATKVKDLTPILPLVKKAVQIKNWETINGIRIDYNHLTIPPPTIVRDGNGAIIRYFEQLEKEGSDQIYEAKLLLIGEGGAGKTTLCRKLFDHTADLPKEKESTSGIDIRPLFFHTQDGIQFRLNVWDFAGQGKYQSAHSFFYTHRSLYVLVDDTRTLDENEAYRTFYHYWLQTAELFGGNSPLLVLHNQKADRVRTGFNLGSFQATFPFVKELFRINLGGNDTVGILDLKKQIERWAQKLPHIGDVVPKTWVKVREDIETEKQTRPYISEERYQEICSTHGITDELKQSDLSHYFHDLGVFLHFQDNPLLRRDVFLQNQWVTDAVYKILDDPEISGKQRGRFDKTDLARLWNEGFYTKRREELLALMLQFELCYQVQDTETYIAPQLLPGDIPKYDLGTDIPLQLKYEYGFMPKGLLYRLIVRLHRLIAQGQLAVWNGGAVLERADAQADVLESLDRRQISVRATGTRAKELVTIVAEKLDELHATFGDRLKVEVKIPCNCQVCKVSDTPHFYDKKDLENRLAKAKPTVECRESFDDVNVQGLLDGVFTRVVNNPVDLLQIGDVRAALELLRPNTKAIELLAQFTHAETEYKYGRIEYQAFRGEQSRIVSAAMDLVK